MAKEEFPFEESEVFYRLILNSSLAYFLIPVGVVLLLFILLEICAFVKDKNSFSIESTFKSLKCDW